MREAALDRRAKVLRNLAINPSFERASTAPIQVERFRNLMSNPLPSSGTGISTGVNGSSGGYDASLRGVRVMVAEGGTGDAGINWQSAAGNITEPGYYTYSAEVEALIAGPVKISVQGQIGTNTPAATQFAAGEKKRISVTVRHTGTGTAAVYFLRGSVAKADFVVRKFMKTKTPFDLPYFDGDTVNDSLASPFGLDYSYSWAGTPGASATIVTGPSPSTTVWTNFQPNPIFEGGAMSGYGNWHGGGPGAINQSVPNEPGAVGMRFLRCAWTVAPTSLSGGPYMDKVAVTPGVVTTVSAYVRSSKEQKIRPDLVWKKTDGSDVATGNTAGAIVTLPANTWVRVVTSGVPPADAAWVQQTYYATTGGSMWAVGDTMDLDAVMVNTSNGAVLDFFCGSYGTGRWADPDFVPTWNGTPNASTSSLKGVNPQNSGTANGAGIQSFFTFDGRGKCMRLIANGPSSKDTYADILGMIGGFNGMRDGVTYTGFARSYQAGPITNPVNGNRPRAFWAVTTGSLYGDLGASTPGPNIQGYTDHRFTFTVNTGGTYKSIRLINGGDQGGGDIWWESIMIVEGDYRGKYFDGDSPGAKWLGTPHASESVGYPPT